MGAGETPGISVADIAKAIGEMWRGLSDDDKKPYQVDPSFCGSHHSTLSFLNRLDLLLLH